VPVRHLLEADVPAVCDALADAFLDDPVMGWIVGREDPTARRTALIEGFFRWNVKAGQRRGHTYVLADGDGAVRAAAVWSPPDVGMYTEAEVELWIPALAGAAGAEAVQRLGALGEVVRTLHPRDRSHFYLATLGVVAEGRGRGLGVETVAPVLARCDADRLPAYLESSNPRNRTFYERLGFRVIWEASPDAGPVLAGMWREPT